jgi:hypothetical protein
MTPFFLGWLLGGASAVLIFVAVVLLDRARTARRHVETESERIQREFAAGVDRMNLQVGRALLPMVTNTMHSISDTFQAIGDYYDFDGDERDGD